MCLHLQEFFVQWQIGIVPKTPMVSPDAMTICSRETPDYAEGLM